jgi:predicted nuclease with TOPRIM domain
MIGKALPEFELLNAFMDEMEKMKARIKELQNGIEKLMETRVGKDWKERGDADLLPEEFQELYKLVK